MSSSLMTFAVFAFLAARDARAASATDCASCDCDCDCESCARKGEAKTKSAAQPAVSVMVANVWILCRMVIPRFAAERLKTVQSQNSGYAATPSQAIGPTDSRANEAPPIPRRFAHPGCC